MDSLGKGYLVLIKDSYYTNEYHKHRTFRRRPY